jgi:uroporphyrin-III C-methyltransferase
LITVRGLRALSSADVVLHDCHVSPELLEACRSDARLVDVGKRPGVQAIRQPRILDLMLEAALGGSNVARLKGGDPSIFARGGEEMEALARAGIPFEVIPGVTAASAAAAACSFSLTRRGTSSSVVVVTGHETPSSGSSPVDWAKLAGLGGTLVVYMGLATLEGVTAELVSCGMDPEVPTVVVSRASMPGQRAVCAPLGEAATATRAAGLESPAIAVIGKAAGCGTAGRPRYPCVPCGDCCLTSDRSG